MNEPDPAVATLDAGSASSESGLAQVRDLYKAGRVDDALASASGALAIHADAFELWNLYGLILRTQARWPEASQAFERAFLLKPDYLEAAVNGAELWLHRNEPTRAVALLARLAPGVAEHPAALATLGRAKANAGDTVAGRSDLMRAVELDPGQASAWQALALLDRQADGPGAAVPWLEQGLAASPENGGLAQALTISLLESGQRKHAREVLEEMLGRFPRASWVHIYLSDVLADGDPAKAETHLRQALTLEPRSVGVLLALAQRLNRKVGNEGAHLDEALGLVKQALSQPGLNAGQAKVAYEIAARAVDFDALAKFGDPLALSRIWGTQGQYAGLLNIIPRVHTPEDRQALLASHTAAGKVLVAKAAESPLTRGRFRPTADKIRVGLLSSDLRGHPVGYFAEPLFAHLPRDRFELYGYGFDMTAPDEWKATFIERATLFRHFDEYTARDAANIIALDSLDVLLDLGGPTGLKLLDVLAFRPAPLQASWLGYPHSTGLGTIDALICDPLLVPPDRALLAEQALVLPRSWIALSERVYADAPTINPATPEDRCGFLTFGSANNPYKYNPETLRAWASVVAATPGSHFAFLRPEAGSTAFRTHVLNHFERWGVDASRVEFHPVRGSHLDLYNDIDISLDTFPLTGGTTTIEAMWMGVPVITLRGEALYERLSHAIVTHAGRGELSVNTLDEFHATALALASDRQWRSAFRKTIRAEIRASPLGDAEGFARDMYAALGAWVTTGAP